MVKKVAVILSGCGFKDGSEIHEATCVLLALDQAGAEITGFAPDREQTIVTNHVDSSQVNEKRNIMTESARIMRGNIKPVSALKVENFDALVFPGGFGAVVNLCSYGRNGTNCEIDKDVKNAAINFINAKKPIGAICIAPVVVAKALEGSGINAILTIGTDKNVAGDIEALGCFHKSCAVDDCVVDTENKIVTTPAYMLATRISQVNAGVSKLAAELIKLA